MMDALWLDAVLFAVMLILLAVLYRMSSYTPQLVPGRSERPETGEPADEWSRFRRRRRLAIRQAGLDPDTAWVGLWFARVLSAGFLASIGLWVFDLPGLAGLGLAGFVLPDLWLLQVRRKRVRKIRTSLSYFLDLATSLMHAGLAPERAFIRAGREGFNEPNPLADEVALLGHELDMGKDRGTAFLQLADRTGVVELRAVASAVQMGLRSGMPLIETLRAQADLLRVRHGEESIRKLNTSTVLSMIPVFLCGMPVFFVVIYFPAFIQIMESMRMIRPR